MERVSLPVPVLLFIFLPLLVGLFFFIDKSDFDKKELLRSVFSIVQSQSSYCRWFGVTFRVLWCINLSIYLAVRIFKRCAFHMIISVGLEFYLLDGVSKKVSEKSKLKGVPIFKEVPKDFFLEVTWNLRM